MSSPDNPSYSGDSPENIAGYEAAARILLTRLLNIHANEAEYVLRNEIIDRLTEELGESPSNELIASDEAWMTFPDRLHETIDQKQSILSLFAVPCSVCTAEFNACGAPQTRSECCTTYRACLATCIQNFSV